VLISASLFVAVNGPIRTVTRTTTIISSGSAQSFCSAASPGQGLPIPTGRWFTAAVNYSGSWEATVVVYDSGSPIFTHCYTGLGRGTFEYANSSLGSASMIRITATKLDGGTSTLNVAVNGHINSTSTPYGSAVVSSTPDGPASFITANCLKEIPQGSTFGSYSNSTSEGYSITYPNETKAFFPLNTCPVPLTLGNYLIDSTIVLNAKFIAAENGSVYEAANGGSSLSVQSNNSTGQYGIFDFILYGNQKVYPCGGSYWTYNQLGLIRVTIPLNSTGDLQFSRMEVQSNGLPETVILCTTTNS
jgi:hypothetical protein